MFESSAEPPAFSELSGSLYAPFQVRAFRAPQLLWVNPLWLESIGARADPWAELAARAWLLETFAVGVPQPAEPASMYIGDWRVMHADRYGATQGSTQGGSGRVGTRGSFQAKGIGATPLVSRRTDWYHSHGFMWLEEAIREAICSEVAARYFPHGAVRSIAVIDTGERIHWNSGDTGERRGILVRPASLRLASLQRSVFFGDAGHASSAQFLDARRTADLWRSIVGASGAPTRWLLDMFVRFGRQYGTGHALRLWPGPPYSSNVTLAGALVDFGGFRSMPSWLRAQGPTRAHGFGSETEFVQMIVRSISAAAGKHGFAVEARDLAAAFEIGLAEGFEEALPLGRLKGSAAGRTITALFRKSFARQQTRRTSIGDDDDGSEWLAAADGGMSGLSETAKAERRAIEQTWQAAGGDHKPLLKFLRPQPKLIRERLLADCQDLIAEADDTGAISPPQVTGFIEDRIESFDAPLPEQASASF